MSEKIEVVAIISPHPGKADRVIELMGGISNIVKSQEPGTLKYQFLKQLGDNPKVFVIETYENQAALKAHGKFPEFKEVGRQLVKEGLLAGKTQIFAMKAASGFTSRL